MGKKEELLSWLNDAYSMEKSVAQVLENHIKDAKDHPDIEARLRKHLEETHLQAERVERAIGAAGGKVSAAKGWLGDAMGTMKGLATGMYRDEMVKNALAWSATEAFEIASYKSLIAAAESLGEIEVAEMCRQNLQEEEAMAEWASTAIATVTLRYLGAQQPA